MKASTRLKILFGVCLFTAASVLYAQSTPYAGQQGRDIKALSTEEIEQYRAGAGMSYAKAAELNHFPGPMHVLELAQQLGLSAEQHGAVKRLMDAHKADARAIGAKVIEAQGRLEALFRRGQVEESELAKAVQDATAIQGQYRLAHLETHRRLRALLTDEQVARYDQLRGYDSHKPHKH